MANGDKPWEKYGGMSAAPWTKYQTVTVSDPLKTGEGMIERAQAQAKQKLASTPMEYSFSGRPLPVSDKEMGHPMSEIHGAPEGLAGMLAIGVPGAASEVVGGGLLGSVVGGGAAGATSSVSGQVLGHKNPISKESLKQTGIETGVGAVGGALLHGAGKGVGAIAKKLRPGVPPSLVKLEELEGVEKRVSSQVSSTANLAKSEESIRKGIVAAPKAIRVNVIDKAYPEITTPVDIAGAGKQAIKSQAGVVANAKPAQVARVARLGYNIKTIEGSLGELMKDPRAFSSGDAPMWEAELSEMVKDLKEAKELPFAKAQRYNTALGVAISKGQGYKLPAEVFHAMRDTQSILQDSMLEAAESEGKAEQYLAANKLYKQFMDDFYNKNAPLKSLLDLKEGMAGQTLRRISKDGRSVQAMRRWFGDDVANGVQKILDDPNLPDRIKDLTAYSRSPSAYQAKLTHGEYQSALKTAKGAEQRATAEFEKQEAAKSRTKTAMKAGAAGALGAGGVWKILQLLGMAPSGAQSHSPLP